MDHVEQGASAQVMEAFSSLAHLFQDPTLKLSPNPRQPKARRRDGPSNRGQAGADQVMEEEEAQPTQKLLKALLQLVVRHDQEIQSMRRMDQFILFLSPDPQGALHLLMQEAAQWKQKMEDASKSQTMPLRQHLMITLLNALHTRAGKIVECKDSDLLYTTSVQKGVILPDRSFPFHRWDPQQKQLVIDKKTPISAPKMKQHLEELLDMLTDRELIVRFHALKPPSPQLDQVVPWRLQINVRSDRPYELLFQLAFNAIWMTVGATMKPHSQGQTPLATMVQSMLNPPKGRGKANLPGKWPKRRLESGPC
jgi:hypothetical protein